MKGFQIIILACFLLVGCQQGKQKALESLQDERMMVDTRMSEELRELDEEIALYQNSIATLGSSEEDFEQHRLLQAELIRLRYQRDSVEVTCQTKLLELQERLHRIELGDY